MRAGCERALRHASCSMLVSGAHVAPPIVCGRPVAPRPLRSRRPAPVPPRAVATGSPHEVEKLMAVSSEKELFAKLDEAKRTGQVGVWGNWADIGRCLCKPREGNAAFAAASPPMPFLPPLYNAPLHSSPPFRHHSLSSYSSSSARRPFLKSSTFPTRLQCWQPPEQQWTSWRSRASWPSYVGSWLRSSASDTCLGRITGA